MVETFVHEDEANASLPAESAILPEEWIGLVLFIAGTALAGAQVFMRATLDIGLTWGQEFVVTMIIWSVFIGAAGVTARRRHVRMDLLAMSLPRRAGAKIEMIAAAACLIYVVLILIAAGKFQVFLFHSGEIDPSTELPSWCLFLGMPVGVALMLLRSIRDVRARINEHHNTL